MLPNEAPRDFENLKVLILRRAPELPRRLAQIATYALHNPNEIAFGTVASIAQNAAVQPSALIRFAQAIGYQGFSDLQEVFRHRLRDNVLSYDERLQQLREHATSATKSTLIFDGFAEASEKSIESLRQKLDPAELERAVAMLAKAETIYLVGLRRSFPITSYMSYAFGKLGIRNNLVAAIGGLAAEDVSFASDKDCLMAISFTPYASETVALTQNAAARNVPIVAITDSPFSPLAAATPIWFEIQEANFEGFRSMAATLALAMTLTIAVAERRKI